MKPFLLLASISLLLGCGDSLHERQQLMNRLDTLDKKLANAYAPGLGEFMNNVQLHHSKLWFAGINENWDLAKFEIQEIDETMEDIEKFQRDRPEVRALSMIDPAIDSVIDAVTQKNGAAFRASYTLLTNTCNKCHVATEHAFNVITIPTQLPVSDQRFAPNAH